MKIAPPPQDYADIGDSEASAAEGSHFAVGSLFVKEGCTFYGFSEPGYGGVMDKFPGPLAMGVMEPTPPATGQSCADGYPSYKCRCEQEMISCVPEDGGLRHFCTLVKSRGGAGERGGPSFIPGKL